MFGSGEFASLLYADANRREVGKIIHSATEAHRAIAVGIVKGDAAMTVDAVEAHLSDIEQRMIESLV